MLLLGAQGGLTKFPKESLSLLLRLLVIMNTRNILSVTMIYPSLLLRRKESISEALRSLGTTFGLRTEKESCLQKLP